MPNKKDSKSPGRPRKFDEGDVLQRATAAFLESGFEAASYEQIATKMGLSKPSLYNAFGDKLALFERVLEGYGEKATEFMISNFENSDSLEDATETLLCAAAKFYSRPNDRSVGCLLMGTALPAASHYDSIRKILADFVSSLEHSLEEIISRKYSREAENLERAPRAVAVHVMSLVSALAVRARTGLPRRKLIAHAKELASLLR